MSKYKVRVYDVGLGGIFTQADGFEDFTFESRLTLKEFAVGELSKGFKHPHKERWIMHGAIIWVEEVHHERD